jgi:tRNA pseudouridine13 synthase
MIPAKADEQNIGLEVFFTSAKGIGGRLRKTAEDFVVEENSLPPERDDEGEFTIAQIRVRNWETNRLIRQLSRQLHISRKRIGFAGTKDRRAVTTQLFSIKAPLEYVKNISLKDVEILDCYSSGKGLSLGDLIGNRFHIVVSETENTSVLENTVKEVSNELDALGGFPNFFGHQRFGTLRPITHIVGKKIMEGDFGGAVHTYLGDPVEIEGEETFSARQAFEKDGDYAEALRTYPKYLGFERAMLNHMVKNEDDFVGAVAVLPKNLTWMFVHAYQSFLFNKILSRRIEQGLLSNEPLPGDIILPPDANGLPDHKKYIDVTEDNIEKVTRKVREKKAFLSGLVPGTESRFADGMQGEIERKVLEQEGLAFKDFAVPQMMELSSKGIRRELVTPMRDFSCDVEGDSVKMHFELMKGCYATSLVREFMKTDIIKY